jgi:exosortase/archaeosortase family protein
MRRAAAILFALTLPLFWTRLLFAAFNDSILRLDANIIGLVVGTTPEGNVVPFADGSREMFIAPGCSSLTNLSLALLSAAAFVNFRGGRWSRATLAWSAASAVAVIAINVTRISLIGLYPSHFDLIHGPAGAAVADCLALAAIVLIGYHRIGHDDAPRVQPQDAGRLSS